MMKYVFVFDHTNYSRWLSVHLVELLQLEQQIPAVFKEFNNGNFMVNKSNNLFSLIPVDLTLEQENKILKDSLGGIDFLNRNDDMQALLPTICRCNSNYRKIMY